MASARVQKVDCRGMQCPQPILQTAKAARKLKGQAAVLEILADDAAFPEDIKSWVRSAGATLETLAEEGGAYRALIRLKHRGAATALASPVPESTRIDCRGMQCPEPILRIARTARKLASGSELVVLADDDAFVEDIKSWVRSARASLVSLDSSAGVHTARIRLATKTDRETRTQKPTVPAVPVVTPNRDVPELDLRGRPATSHLDALSGFATGRADQRVAVLADDATFAHTLVAWCGQGGHQLLNLDTSATPVRAEVRLGVSVAPVQQIANQPHPIAAAEETTPRAVLLVLNNSHEALLAALLVANGAAAQGMETTIFFSFWGLNCLRGNSLEDEIEASKRGVLGRLFMRRKPRPSAATDLVPIKNQRVSLVQRMFKTMMPNGPRKQGLGQFNFGGMGLNMLTGIMRDQNVLSLPEMMQEAVEFDVKFIVCTMSMGVMGITRDDLMQLPNMVFAGVASFVEESKDASISLVF